MRLHLTTIGETGRQRDRESDAERQRKEAGRIRRHRLMSGERLKRRQRRQLLSEIRSDHSAVSARRIWANTLCYQWILHLRANRMLQPRLLCFFLHGTVYMYVPHTVQLVKSVTFRLILLNFRIRGGGAGGRGRVCWSQGHLNPFYIHFYVA